MPRFYVTLIDTKGTSQITNYKYISNNHHAIDSFEYTPGIVKKIINPEQTSSLRVRHDAYVKNGRVIIGYAEDLANGGKSVTVNGEVVCLFSPPTTPLLGLTYANYYARSILITSL